MNTLRIITTILFSLVSLNSISQEEWVTYSCSGHAKSLGLNLSFKHPSDWKPSEGQRPHIVQMFNKELNDGEIQFGLYINKFEVAPTSEEIDEILSYANAKRAYSGTLYDFSNDLRIDGLKCARFTTEGEELIYDTLIKGLTVAHVFVYDDYLIQLNFMFTSYDQKFETMRKLYSENKRTIQTIMSYVAVVSQWE